MSSTELIVFLAIFSLILFFRIRATPGLLDFFKTATGLTVGLYELIIVPASFVKVMMLSENFLYSFIVVSYLIYLVTTNIKQRNNKKTSDVIQNTKTYKQELIDDWAANSNVVWSGNVANVTFSYKAKSGTQSKRTVDLNRLLVAENGKLYFDAYCHKRNDDRSFYIDSIVTKLSVNGKNYGVYDYIENNIGVVVS